MKFPLFALATALSLATATPSQAAPAPQDWGLIDGGLFAGQAGDNADRELYSHGPGQPDGLRVWLFVHDQAGETDSAKVLDWYAAPWVKDMAETVSPGLPVRVSLRSHVPGLTDIDYHAGSDAERIMEVANAGERHALSEGQPIGGLNLFVLLVGDVPGNWPTGTRGTSNPLRGTAIISNHGHRHIFAHEVGHLLGATHEAAESRPFCVTNMGGMTLGLLSCLYYTKANDENIRRYIDTLR
jgi:hypothetical protein